MKTKTPDIEFLSSRVYSTRFILGVVAAFFCFLGKLSLYGLFVGLAFYVVSFPILVWGFRVSPSDMGGRTTFYTLGLGSYLCVWLTLWILLNTYSLT